MDSADPAASAPILAALTAILERHEQMFARTRGELSSLKHISCQLHHKDPRVGKNCSKEFWRTGVTANTDLIKITWIRQEMKKSRS